MKLFGREPAFWIGVVVSLVMAVLGVLTGNGLISDAAAGQVKDLTTATAQLLVLLAPIIAGILIRGQVTPTASPSLPTGTIVQVITPEGRPNTSTVL